MKELAAQPDLSVEDLVGRVADDFTERLHRGEHPDVEEYTQRYPQIAPLLRQALPALQAIAPLASDAGLGNAASASPEQLTGFLGDFRIRHEVGRGGMGVVYEAEQISLGRRVALKVLPFAAALDPKQLQRFRNEAQAAAHLHHTNIVPVHAVGCERGLHFYAMQFIDGQSLAAVLAELRGAREARKSRREIPDRAPDRSEGPETGSPADCTRQEASTRVELGTRTLEIVSDFEFRTASFFRTAARLALQAAEALEHAHTEGVVHRDIKPANLLVGARGNLWITDFGLAHFRGDVGLTMTGDVLGTLRYMSPEQALGQRERVDHRADIYSLGATLYELLTLEPVHDGRERQELLRQIGSEEPRPPRRLNAVIPADLETIVLKALDKEPHGRYATAQELADDLRRFLEDKPIRAKRPTLLQRTRKWARRHKTAVAAGALVLLLALAAWAVSTVLIVRQRNEARTQRELAQQQRQLARQAVDEMYTEVAEQWLAHQPHMQGLQRRFLLKALRYYQAFAQEQGTDAAVRHQAGIAYRRLGDIQFRLGQPAAAEAAYGQAIDAHTELAAAFAGVPEYRRELAAAQNNLGALLVEVGRLAEAEQAHRAALLVGEKLAADFPAEPPYRGALAKSHSNLGTVLAATARPREAEHAFGQAMALYEILTADVPAAPEYREGLAESANNLASVLADRGQPQEAEQTHRRALALRQRLVEEFPHVPRYRNQLAGTRDNLALLFRSGGRIREAEDAWRQALPLLEKLATEFPGLGQYQAQWARSHNNLAILLKETGRPQEAEQAYRQAIALYERLAADSPGMRQYRHELAMCHSNLGNLLRQTGRPDEAAQAFRHAVGVLKTLASELSGATVYRRYLARTHINLAMLFEENGGNREAEQSFHQAVALYERLAVESPDEPSCRHETALCLTHLGNLLRQTGRPEEALTSCRQAVGWAQKAIELAPQDAAYWSARGIAQFRAGQWREAREALDKAVELRHDGDCQDWFYLAMVHLRLGDREPARQWYDRACAELGKGQQPADKRLLRLRAETAAALEVPLPQESPEKSVG
jgi:serine/threonine protein kinase/tetratricopeptide (TPR) repeat protein